MVIPWQRINAVLLLLVLFALLALIAMSAMRAEGGPLDPPGPPGSTNGVRLPGEPISGPTVISQPGHYYLTGNISVTGGVQAIVIASNDVTLDLGGFTISGTDTGGSRGVIVADANPKYARIAITNGQVRDLYYGIDVDAGTQVRIDNVGAYSNAVGIQLGDSAVLSDCFVDQSFAWGISMDGLSSTIRECTILNSASDGILITGAGNLVERSHLRGNWNLQQPTAYGVRITGDHNVIRESHLTGNGLYNVHLTASSDFNLLIDNALCSTEDLSTTNKVGTPDHLNSC